jgi:hypothetical protein
VEVKGPDLDGPILLADGALVTRVAENAGLPAALGRRPNSSFVPDLMLRTRPRVDLGPRYTVTYVIPGLHGEVARVIQDLYPYAKLRPAPSIAPGQTVTYTAPEQHTFGTEKTRGGWYIATPYLRDNLVAAGLPASAPAAGGGSEVLGTLFGTLAVLGTLFGTLAALGLVLTLAALLTRRRGQRRAVIA